MNAQPIKMSDNLECTYFAYLIYETNVVFWSIIFKDINKCFSNSWFLKRSCTKLFLLPSMCTVYWKVLLCRMCILCLFDYLTNVIFLKSCFLRKITSFLKKLWLLPNYICLLNQLNKVCTFLHNWTFKYIMHTILNVKRLVALILRITTSKKHYFIS